MSFQTSITFFPSVEYKKRLFTECSSIIHIHCIEKKSNLDILLTISFYVLQKKEVIQKRHEGNEYMMTQVTRWECLKPHAQNMLVLL